MIRNIIFDLGGVLLNLDMNRTADTFRKLGMADFDEHFSQAKQTGIFDAFDCGRISPLEFRNKLKSHLPSIVNDGQIDEAWNAMLLDLPPSRLELLKSLSKNYRLFLFSNTNEIHVRAFSHYLKKEFGFDDFSGYFEQWYYSCRIGKRKPDVEAFQFVLSENNLIAEETIFIDDSLQHVDGANACGIKGILLAKNQEISSLVSQLGLI